MTRINTNVISLSAQNTLAKSNNQLTDTLTRLSTGLRINTGKDDPAGLIAATSLGNDIKSTQQAIANSQVANQMISTADSALGQINTLLTSVRGLVTQAANTGAMSSAQIAANQLQIDSSLDAINRISQTTKFQGQNLLDGSLGFLTAGTSSNYAATVKDLQVNQVNMGTASQVAVDVKVTAAATQAVISDLVPVGTTPTGQLKFADGTSMTISAPVGGTSFNTKSIAVVEVASGTTVNGVSVTTTTPTAAYAGNTLTITVANAGTTQASAIAAAINLVTDSGSGQKFSVDMSTATGAYVAGTDLPTSATDASTTITTTTGGSLKISAKTADSMYNGTHIVWDTTGTSATPNVSYTAGAGSSPGTLTIQVRGTTVPASTTTTLQAVADAINNSSDTNVQKFAATDTVTGLKTGIGGSFDSTKDGGTAVVGHVSAGHAHISDGSGTITINVQSLTDTSALNNMKITVVEGAAGTTTTSASFDNSYAVGNATGQLTITLANNKTVTANDVQNALNAIGGSSFAAFATPLATGTDIVTPPTAGTTPTSATGLTTGGLNGTVSTTGAITLASTGGGNISFTIASKAWGVAQNGLTVKYTNNADLVNPVSAAYISGTNTLTINLALGNAAITATDLDTAFTNMTGKAAFDLRYAKTGAASSTQNLDGTVFTAHADSTSASGTNGAAASQIAHITDGSGNDIHLTVTANNVNTNKTGTSLNNMLINVVEGGVGFNTTTASYNASSGVNGILTITLANNKAVSVAEINQAITDMADPAFAVGGTAGNYLAVATQNAGGAVITAPTAAGTPLVITQGSTANGAYDIAGKNAALAGATVGGTFTGGTGTALDPGLQADLVMQLGGNAGSQVFTFISGTTADQMMTAISASSDSTGVGASLNASTGALELTSTGYGAAQFVNVNVVKEGTGGTFATNLKNILGHSATHAAGTDIAATVNNVAATGVGNTVSINTPSLAFNATLADGAAAGTEVTFNINGGGALFQLGAQVVSSQQARLGIQSVDSANLGGTAGRLYELGSGKDAALASNTRLAAKIVTAAADQVSAIRGRLGAFQKATVDTNISSLTDAVTNLTAAQSSIQDADFAAESSNLTRAQILVQSGTAVLGIANKNPENVLSLLR